jgi:MFS transporter, DHA1 family, multidrug resistance protein
MLPSANALISLAVPRDSQGAAFGLSSTAASLSSALGPLAGAALATQLGLRSVFVAAGLLVAATGIAASLARKPVEWPGDEEATAVPPRR